LPTITRSTFATTRSPDSWIFVIGLLAVRRRVAALVPRS
jgi:hypothetical protein